MRFTGVAFIAAAKINCIIGYGLRPIANGLRPVATYCRLAPMNEFEQRRRDIIKEYIAEFVQKTNGGRVFTLDRSALDTRIESVRTGLTDEERKEWEDWADIHSGFWNHYSVDRYMDDLTTKEMLMLPVAPPLLIEREMFGYAWRSMPEERGRLYPDEVCFWVDFENEVRSFTDPIVEENPEREVDDVLYNSLHPCEGGEKYFLLDQVLTPLEAAGLLESGFRNVAQEWDHSNPLGNTDRFLIADQNKTIPIEIKPTHDLLFPEKAVDVIRRYNAAAKEVKAAQECTIDWTNIGHPLTKLVSYMFLARSRYGVLSSGTRSYFFKVEITDVPRVLITDAWLVGQKDFLRAWAYLYHLAERDGDFQPPVGGFQEWPTWTSGSTPDRDQPDRRNDTEGRDGVDDSTDEQPAESRNIDDQDRSALGSKTPSWMTWLDPSMAPSIPRVDGNDVKFVRLLSPVRLLLPGNQDVYLAHWKGQKVAVKVYDFDEDLEYFENKIRSCEHLKDSWGVLVPEPYFVADLFGVVLLGMQLGRIPNSSDGEIESERDTLFRTLQSKYGFDPSDLKPRQVIYVPDKSGTGPDRLLLLMGGHTE